MPGDLSDSNEESEPNASKLSPNETIVCPDICSHHVGREGINTVFSLPIDDVFTLIFTNSKFMLDLFEARKTYGRSTLVNTKWIIKNSLFLDVVASAWQSNPETNQKIRQVTYTVTLPTNSFGPKVSHVTETQVRFLASFVHL